MKITIYPFFVSIYYYIVPVLESFVIFPSPPLSLNNYQNRLEATLLSAKVDTYLPQYIGPSAVPECRPGIDARLMGTTQRTGYTHKKTYIGLYQTRYYSHSRVEFRKKRSVRINPQGNDPGLLNSYSVPGFHLDLHIGETKIHYVLQEISI